MYLLMILAMTSAVAGASSDGLTTTALPAAMAPAMGTSASCSGKFQGPMMRTRPYGSRWMKVVSSRVSAFLATYSSAMHSSRSLRSPLQMSLSN